MTRLLCRNVVADFSQWKSVFDSHADAQRASGLHVKHVWRNIENGNEVFMLFDVTDLAKARAFLTSPAVPEAQTASGMTEKPDMWFIA
ncbi:MAG TPA: hypothetical protein VMV81_11600 [Phycisphaerae bacterium]|nr:hypothetical protein [Phycisphaerae bacterium]